MKTFTDLEQSKKLAEFLPVKSADLCYLSKDERGAEYFEEPSVNDGTMEDTDIPCWSLAALLAAVPRIEHLRPSIDLNPKLDSNEVAIYYHSEDSPYIVRDNLIDAAFEMICWLKENNEL